MNPFAFTQFRSIAAILFLLTISHWAQAQGMCTVKPSGCSQYYTMQKGTLPGNTTIPIVVNGNNSTLSPAISDAIAQINAQNNSSNGNGSGITFVLSSSYPASGPYLTLNMDSTTTQPPCGSCVGQSDMTSAYGNPAVYDSGVVNIYLNSQTCGGACFNPGAPYAFQSAVTGTITHELVHTLGGGDSPEDSLDVMGPFVGVNNGLGNNLLNPCDAAGIQANRTIRNTGQGAVCTPN